MTSTSIASAAATEAAPTRDSFSESDVSPGRSRAWRHLLLGTVVVCALNLWLGDQGFVSADELVAHQQVDLLDGGAWTEPFREPTVAPNGEWNPLDSVSNGEGVYAPYAKHPAFPFALSVGSAVFGRIGRFFVVAIGSVVAAAVIGLGAERRRSGAGAWGFWIALIGTPLFHHSAILWGHSLAIACAAVACFGLVGLLDRTSPSLSSRPLWLLDLLALAGGVVGAMLLRSEATLFFLAMGGVVGLLGLIRRSPKFVTVGALIGILTIGLYLAESVLRERILGPAPDSRLDLPVEPLLDLGIRSSLFKLWTIGGDAGLLGVLRLIGLGLLGFEAWKSRADASAVQVPVVAAGAVAYLAATLAGETFSFAVTVPLVVIGLLLVRLDDFSRVVIGTSVLYFVGVVLTSHSSAGGGDWGGRYLALSLAPLVVVAAPELHARWEEARGSESRWNMSSHRVLIAGGAVASLTLVVGMVHGLHEHRQMTTELLADATVLIDEFSEPGEVLVVTDARMSRLLAEAEFDRRLFQVPETDLATFGEALDPEIESFVVLDFLSPVDLPANWFVSDEKGVLRRIER